jgi:hypothetical protein
LIFIYQLHRRRYWPNASLSILLRAALASGMLAAALPIGRARIYLQNQLFNNFQQKFYRNIFKLKLLF